MGRRLQPVVAERRLHKSAFVPPGRGLRGSLAPTSCAMLRLSSKETERERERERERTHIHTYIRTYVRTYIHTYIHT